MISLLGLFFILIASLIYVIASYVVPLTMNVSAFTAVIMAMPLVFLEYQGSVRGNRLLHGSITTYQIELLTVVFTFAGIFIMNKFVIKDKLRWNDIAGIIVVMAGLFLSFGVENTEEEQFEQKVHDKLSAW